MTASDYKALRVHRDGNGVRAGFERLERVAPGAGEVLIRSRYSGINYKDALAATGAGRIMRRFPLTAGIDVAGRVERSNDERFSAGVPVLVTGCGLGETRDGGYAEYVCAPADAVVPIPEGLDERTAMAIGTAGFTAALAIERMQHNGLAPAGGPVIVTGASGGVGSLAIDMLAGAGYEVVAVTGRREHTEYLRALGAAEVLDRRTLEFGTRPLESARWAGAIDNVGGDMLAWLTRTTHPLGAIASIGLAGGDEFGASVMPFILRGIVLIGVNCDRVSREQRLALWRRLAGEHGPRHLAQIAGREVGFAELPGELEQFLRGGGRGRSVVRIA